MRNRHPRGGRRLGATALLLWVVGGSSGALAQAIFVASSKTVGPLPIIVGMPLRYVLTLDNVGATGPVRVIDKLPDCVKAADFDVARDVVVSPGPADVSYSVASGTLTVDFGAFGAGERQTISILNLMPVEEGVICCNEAVVQAGVDVGSDDPTTPGPPDATCFTAEHARSGSADLRGATKEASPRSVVRAGDPIVYTITLRNSGDEPAERLVVKDELPACLDASAFDPASHVSVSPGPADLLYNPVTRALSVSFVALPPAPAAGSTQTVVITGLLAGGPTAVCCNQANIKAGELDVTSDDPAVVGTDQPTCLAFVDDAPATTRLLRNADWPIFAKPEIFTGPSPGCGDPLDPSIVLDPFGIDCLSSAFPIPDDDDTHAIDVASGDPDPEPGAIGAFSGILFYYQVDRRPAVGDGLRLVKEANAADPERYIIRISF